MFKGIGNIASLLKQARNLSGQMGEVTERLKGQRVAGTAGGGMVTVHANGLGNILKVEFDDEQADLEMIQDLLPAAINDALSKAKALNMEAMQSMTGGLTLPAGLDDALKQLTEVDADEAAKPGSPVDAVDDDVIEGEIEDDETLR